MPKFELETVESDIVKAQEAAPKKYGAHVMETGVPKKQITRLSDMARDMEVGVSSFFFTDIFDSRALISELVKQFGNGSYESKFYDGSDPQLPRGWRVWREQRTPRVRKTKKTAAPAEPVAGAAI